MQSKHKTIVVTNRKGGVGKTSIAIHVAAGLATQGYKVGMVDTDPQGHTSVALGLPKSNGLYHVMVDPTAQLSEWLQIPRPARYLPASVTQSEIHLYVLPGSKGTALIPMEQSSSLRLRRVIRDMADLLELDFVVVDTGPTSSMFDGSVNLAADFFLYVTECASLSYDGLAVALDDLNAMNQDAREYGLNEAKVLGIVPNKLRTYTRNHRENISILAKQFPGLVWKPLRELTAIETAMDNGQTVWSYDPSSDAAIEMHNHLITRLMTTLKQEGIIHA